MDNNFLLQQEIECQHNLLKTYQESKKLFTRAEEVLIEMQFFIAPMLEHRDALDHIMRYMEMRQAGLSQQALNELNKALGHEIRAYFDTADFVCVTVRQYIASSMKSISKRKVERIWSDYLKIREKVLKVSEEIAEIRITRKGTMECIEKYKVVLDEIFEIYSEYISKIEPQIKLKKKLL